MIEYPDLTAERVIKRERVEVGNVIYHRKIWSNRFIDTYKRVLFDGAKSMVRERISEHEWEAVATAYPVIVDSES